MVAEVLEEDAAGAEVELLDVVAGQVKCGGYRGSIVRYVIGGTIAGAWTYEGMHLRL